MTAENVLVGALVLNAVAGFGYRVYRLGRGGPVADVVGQGLLGLILVGLAVALAAGVGWPRWIALAYGLLFGVIVMPLYVPAVLIPMRPGTIDYAFTAVYWLALAVIVVASLMM